MTNYQGALMIIGVCCFVLLLIAVKSKSHLILNFVFRSVTGTLLLFLLNRGMEMMDISLSVNLNMATVLTSGFLGFPGVILLYGIKIYSLL